LSPAACGGVSGVLGSSATSDPPIRNPQSAIRNP
jgi:hypothetical protein